MHFDIFNIEDVFFKYYRELINQEVNNFTAKIHAKTFGEQIELYCKLIIIRPPQPTQYCDKPFCMIELCL